MAKLVLRPAASGTQATAVLATLTGALVALTITDRAGGPDLNLSVLYTIPPLIGAVLLTAPTSIGLAGASTVAWAVAEPGPASAVGSAMHLVDAAIRFLGVTAVVLVVKALRHATERAVDSDIRAREFLDLAAHQLRTPVAGVRACAETLIQVGATEEQEPLLLDLASEAARIGRIVNNLLWVARLDGGAVFPVRRCNPAAICREELARIERRTTGVTVDLRAGWIGAAGLAEDVLRETVANLADNASRHAASRIEVSVAMTAAELVVTVRDDGPGPPPGMEEEMFGFFVSGDGGLGLGLALCRGAARRTGGDLTYRDGRFELRLPVSLDGSGLLGARSRPLDVAPPETPAPSPATRPGAD